MTFILILLIMINLLRNIFVAWNRNAEFILNRSIGKAVATEIGEDIIYSRKGAIVDTESSRERRGLTHLFYAWKFLDNEMQ